MPYETRNPSGAKELLDGGSWIYLDVRTTQEFADGHVQDAYNVPFAVLDGAGQMAPNDDFVAVAQRHFAPDAAIVVGCAAGGRSARACELLAAAGFTRLVNMHGGFSGARGPSGEVVEPGWQALGYPVARDPHPDRTYAKLSAGPD